MRCRGSTPAKSSPPCRASTTAKSRSFSITARGRETDHHLLARLAEDIREKSRHRRLPRLRRPAVGRQEAADTAARFALTLQSIGDGVIVTDAGERITMINPVACELTGCGAAEALGRPLDDIFHIVSCLDGRRVPSPVREALESGKTVTPADHTDLIARNSRRRHIADSAAPIRSPDGKTAGAILVFRDVTLEYRKRDRLNMSLSLLRQAADGNAMHFSASIRRRSNRSPSSTATSGSCRKSTARLSRFRSGCRRRIMRVSGSGPKRLRPGGRVPVPAR